MVALCGGGVNEWQGREFIGFLELLEAAYPAILEGSFSKPAPCCATSGSQPKNRQLPMGKLLHGREQEANKAQAVHTP
jgi:hypothetical protein